MIDVFELIRKVWDDNDAWQWGLAGATAALMLVVSFAVRRWVRRRHAALSQTEERELLEAPLEIASRTSSAFLIAASLLPAFYTLRLPPQVRHGLTVLLTVIGFWQLGVWTSGAVVAWLLARRRAAGVPSAMRGSLGIAAFVVRIVVWTVIALLTLDNLGVDVTTLVAGLGVGGIAIALAVQNVLGDLFASLSITLDRPFVEGDTISVAGFTGRVEQIGVKSTRLRSVNGEQIIISNADLLKSQLQNWGRMLERRVVFTLNVTYETPRANLRRVPQIMREIIERTEGTRFDRSTFSKYGNFALEFETAYWILSPDYGLYMQRQESIYFAIHEAFEKEGIAFAYPTQRVWLAQVSEPGRVGASEAALAPAARTEPR